MRQLAMTVAATALAATGAMAQDAAPFGSEADTAYAALLWDVMVAERLVGENALRSFPYEGTDPHGMMLETFYTRATVDGHDGALIVKRNYGPEGVSVDEVLGDPAGHLGAVTVMFQRAAGYDDETGNWFWVKYLPDGLLDKTPDGMQLAGLVGKGMDSGCIACHAGAGGDDMIFTTDADVTAAN